MRRVRLRSAAVACAAVGALGLGAAAPGWFDGDEGRAPVVRATPLALRGGGDASLLAPPPPLPPAVRGFTAGEAVVEVLEAFPAPDPAPGTQPVATATNPTHEGFPLVVSVVEASADGSWVHVRLPQRPNGISGWVPAEQLLTWEVPNRVEVSLSTHLLRVYRGDSDEVLFETDVATGRPETPTPVGEFFIDIVNPLGHHPVYGWGQLSVSGFSDVLQRFGGGIGQIAIHGWNDDSVMGRAASNGCIRMRNADVAQVAALAPLGTPVRIVP